MTNALLWSRVRRREEYGTFSNSSSARMSSPSVAGREQKGRVFRKVSRTIHLSFISKISFLRASNLEHTHTHRGPTQNKIHKQTWCSVTTPSVLPALSKVKMSPSHLAALLGVLGSELQLERRRLFLLGETCSSVAESKSNRTQRKQIKYPC